jgi:hypothetical protein
VDPLGHWKRGNGMALWSVTVTQHTHTGVGTPSERRRNGVAAASERMVTQVKTVDARARLPGTPPLRSSSKTDPPAYRTARGRPSVLWRQSAAQLSGVRAGGVSTATVPQLSRGRGGHSQVGPPGRARRPPGAPGPGAAPPRPPPPRGRTRSSAPAPAAPARPALQGGVVWGVRGMP